MPTNHLELEAVNANTLLSRLIGALTARFGPNGSLVDDHELDLCLALFR
jgi:hypothetical protein